MSSKMQASRFEFKYLVSEWAARRIREQILLHLRPDSFTQGEGYHVQSLYLDSPDLHLCRQTICGEKNRFKLRVRFYDNDPHKPVFLEIKRRVTVAVLKQRACVKREVVDQILATFDPDPSYLAKATPDNLRALQNFCDLARAINARPAAYTSYQREAYESEFDNSQRLTFDRYLRAGEYRGALSCEGFESWPLVPFSGVVFEMKFTDRFPTWMHDLAVEFNLDRISVPKYVECVNMVDEAHARFFGTDRRFVLDKPLRFHAPPTAPPETRLSGAADLSDSSFAWPAGSN